MTYLEALNRYWRENDERLGINEAGLYFALVDIANKGKWSDTFTAANDVLLLKLNISHKTFRKARQNLIDCGLIGIVKKGVSKTLTMYQFLMCKSDTKTDTKSDIKKNIKTDIKSDTKTDTKKGGYKGGNKLPPNDSMDNQDSQDAKSERVRSCTHTHEEESSEFDRLFGEISVMLLGHAGDIWREEMSKMHGVTDFDVAFIQFRGYVIQNALEKNIQSQSDFRRYFNWRAKEFLTDEAKKAPVKYLATIEKLSDTRWVVHQYGGTDPIPVGTPDPPSPYHVWTGTQWEHA